MNKTIFFIVLLSVFSFADLDKFVPDGQGTANPINSNKDDKGDPTDGEVGIIGTLAGAYNQTREAVKAVYDEIQYWKGIGATYGMLKDWYANQKAKYKAIRRTVAKLSHNPSDVFSNVEGKDWFETILNVLDAPLAYTQHYTGTATSLVNQTDNFAYGGMRNLDRVFNHAEKYVTLVGESKISGMLMPTTDDIYNKFDEIIYNSPNISDEWKRRIINEENHGRFVQVIQNGDTSWVLQPFSESEEKARQDRKTAAMQTFLDQNNALFLAADVESFPETRIINTIKGLTASATGNSAMYYEWAIQSMNTLSKKIEEIDQKFKDGKMNNIMDLQILAAKLELEMVNANNKRILHELEALKIHHAMLGYEIWKHGRARAFDESATGDVLTLREIASERLQDIKIRNHKEFGDSIHGRQRHRGIFR